MKASIVTTLAAVTVALGALGPSAVRAQAHTDHLMVVPGELTWADAPAVALGAKIAVIEGPLNKALPFTFRLRLPENAQDRAPYAPDVRAGDGALGHLLLRCRRHLRPVEGPGARTGQRRDHAAWHADVRLHEGGDHHPVARRRSVGPDLPEPGRRSEKETVTVDPRQLWRAIERRGLEVPRARPWAESRATTL